MGQAKVLIVFGFIITMPGRPPLPLPLLPVSITSVLIIGSSGRGSRPRGGGDPPAVSAAGVGLLLVDGGCGLATQGRPQGITGKGMGMGTGMGMGRIRGKGKDIRGSPKVIG